MASRDFHQSSETIPTKAMAEFDDRLNDQRLLVTFSLAASYEEEGEGNVRGETTKFPSQKGKIFFFKTEGFKEV